MSTRADLLSKIDEHLTREKMSPRAFSLLVSRDHKWLSRLRRGQATLATIERAEAVLRGEVREPLAPKRDATARTASAQASV